MMVHVHLCRTIASWWSHATKMILALMRMIATIPAVLLMITMTHKLLMWAPHELLLLHTNKLLIMRLLMRLLANHIWWWHVASRNSQSLLRMFSHPMRLRHIWIRRLLHHRHHFIRTVFMLLLTILVRRMMLLHLMMLMLSTIRLHASTAVDVVHLRMVWTTRAVVVWNIG